MTKRAERSPLVEAAEAVDRELVHFDRLAREALDTRLDSQKKLGRAGRLLADLCDVEERLRARVGDLVTAVASTGEHQQTLATQVHTWALEVQARVKMFEQLQIGLGALGDATASVHETLTADQVDLDQVTAQVTMLVEQAEILESAAAQAGFVDVAREGRARREQLQAAVAKLGRVARTPLPEA